MPPVADWARLVAAGIAADRTRLVLWLPACLGCGILLYFSFRSEPAPAAGMVALALSALGLACIRRSRIRQAFAAASVAVSLGFVAAQWRAERAPPMPDIGRKASLVLGQVEAIDVLSDGRRRLTIGAARIGPAPPKGAPGDAEPEDLVATARSLRVTLRDTDETSLLVGDGVRLRVLLHPPSPPDYPGGRDPQRDAFFDGLGGSGGALADVVVVQHGQPSLTAPLRRMREAIASRILSVLPGPRGAVAATLLTGLSSAIPQDDRDAFAASGLAHLLAVAGLHLGIVMGIALTLVRMGLAAWEWSALRLPCRQIAALAALAAGGGYMLLTGLHLPGLRSLAMATVAMLGLVIGRRAVTLRALAFAAGLILLAAPATLLDVGFQMSFAAVMALLAGYEAARPLVLHLQTQGVRGRIGLFCFQLFFTSLVAGAASLPYAAYHFGRMQFYFVLANLVAVPLTAFWVMPLGLISLALMPLGLDGPTLRAMGLGTDLILFLARAVARLPAASLAVPAMPSWGLLAVSLGLLWLCLWRRRWRFAGLLPLAIGLASSWLVAAPDLLVSQDGRAIAWRAGGTMLVEQAAWGDPVTVSDWRRAWGVATPPVRLPDAGGVADVPGVTCNPSACLLERRGRTVLLLRAGGQLDPGDCDGVALLVSPAPSHGACPGVPRIDRFSVWRDGPEAVWLRASGPVVQSARGRRGERPWIPSAPVPGGGRRPTLPMALAE